VKATAPVDWAVKAALESAHAVTNLVTVIVLLLWFAVQSQRWPVHVIDTDQRGEGNIPRRMGVPYGNKRPAIAINDPDDASRELHS
jgi:hypothetical protein